MSKFLNEYYLANAEALKDAIRAFSVQQITTALAAAEKKAAHPESRREEKLFCKLIMCIMEMRICELKGLDK
jgi:hypothetical protein